MSKDIDGVTAFLRLHNVESPILEQIVDVLYDTIVLDMPDSGSIAVVNGDALMVRGLRWVVQDRDVDLLKNILTGFSSFVATGAILPPSTTASMIQGVTGVVSSAFLIIRNLIKRGAKLDPIQFHILGELRRRPGSTSKELAEALSSSEYTWTNAQITNELNHLSRVRLGDGTVIAFAVSDGEERWSAADL